MKKVGLMFSGQGAQYAGMGLDLYTHYDLVKAVYLESEKVTGYPIREISFKNDQRLNQTKYTQVCMLTLYQAILVLLEEKGVHFDYSMGLSLGEYGAYLHQNVFDFKTGLNIVKKRGSLMEKASLNQLGSMSAIIGLEADQLLGLIEQVEGYVSIANYNSYQQLVISGEQEAVTLLGKLAKKNGAKRVIPLKTSGGFHSRLMTLASKSFLNYLDDLELREPTQCLFINTTGKKYQGELKYHMASQLTQSVRFYQMVEEMIKEGVDTFIEIGPKRTLSQLVRRINRSVTVLNIEDRESLIKTLTYLEENQYEL